MKKLILSTLIITITLITINAMWTFKSKLIVETSNNIDYVEEVYDEPNDAGYIFDDFGKQINIPLGNNN